MEGSILVFKFEFLVFLFCFLKFGGNIGVSRFFELRVRMMMFDVFIGFWDLVFKIRFVFDFLVC